MHIIHVSSEIAKVAKVGGLADVVYGLSKELIKQGHKAEVILPKDDTIDYSLLQDLKVHYRDLWSYDGIYKYNNTIWSAKIDGITLYLIEPHHPEFFFSRGQIYGCDDDTDRFLYFSRVVVEFLFKANISPDTLHVHDWPVAAIPLLHDEMYIPLGIKPINILLTLHNLEHQGKCLPKHLTRTGLRGDDYLLPNKLQDPSNPKLLNLLKGGIKYAKSITTVSPSYEKEIKTLKGGHGLHLTLKEETHKLTGILNGIDADFWNPEIDPYLKENFPAHAPFTDEKWSLTIKQKEKNKTELRKRLGLENKHSPIFACITRLVSQKSPLLIAEAFKHIIASGGQCIILGSAHSPDILSLFSLLKSECKTNTPEQGAILLEYDEELSHLIYAGSDMLMIPSLFEPCGLTQMIALRYGSVPIVRKTGGLKDTVFDIGNLSKKGNGFVFQSLKAKKLNETLDRAHSLWKKSPETWKELIKHGMQKDFSWTSSTNEYLRLYQKAHPS
jgi:starch synthase